MWPAAFILEYHRLGVDPQGPCNVQLAKTSKVDGPVFVRFFAVGFVGYVLYRYSIGVGSTTE